ncbi:hypothetical protein [Gloeothece verrucosa]|uniref:Uncharacterized protein n=1 Tax=Gloeothece verrucosa (strain PCC 7822) TaxID=497965 RepID=E0UAV9_GLOV7|nr:hypothetical protein [Gloeothece verrucosa]ADN15081.1 conserved hypothetical protein [Gloeothece verrucosa PCC 7822]
MSYSFDIIGITPVLTFFNYQQQHEHNPHRGKTHLGSYECSLDSFIKSTKMVPSRPNWDWDEVTNIMIKFWLKNEDKIRYWKNELTRGKQEENIIVARVVNFEALRNELESLFEA